jgi:hypothetical protein
VEGGFARRAAIWDDSQSLDSKLTCLTRTDVSCQTGEVKVGSDRSFRSVEELAFITVPTAVISGIDHRHPTALAEQLAHVLPNGHLAPVALSAELRTAEDFARALAPAIRDFLTNVVARS